jgi:hypothetical protein
MIKYLNLFKWRTFFSVIILTIYSSLSRHMNYKIDAVRTRSKFVQSWLLKMPYSDTLQEDLDILFLP